jgi:hypothetical protein
LVSTTLDQNVTGFVLDGRFRFCNCHCQNRFMNEKRGKQSKVPKRRRSRSSQGLNPVATFLADGSRLATLREHVDLKTPTKTHVELSRSEWVKLVASRLAAEPPSFEVAMFGVGPINRDRAIYEIRKGSRIGRELIEIERRTISFEADALRRRGIRRYR